MAPYHRRRPTPCFVPNVVGANPFVAGGGGVRPRIHGHGAATSPSAVPALSTLLTSVEVFDGSEIADAVVRSDAFWSTLSAKLPYVLLAQLLASIAFVAIASVATAQGKFLLDVVSSPDEGEEAARAKRKGAATKFRRADDPPPLPLDFAKLLLCLLIDALGSANEVVPLAGELVDAVYAPMAALALRQLFSGSNVVLLLEFLEEILPFTDVLPLATICWVVESFFADGQLAQILRIGEFAPVQSDSKDYMIDVGRTLNDRDNDGE